MKSQNHHTSGPNPLAPSHSNRRIFKNRHSSHYQPEYLQRPSKTTVYAYGNRVVLRQSTSDETSDFDRESHAESLSLEWPPTQRIWESMRYYQAGQPLGRHGLLVSLNKMISTISPA
ncbi:unnamed protein product [Penicillium salamii]|nr:unnamed protein product [Penicillium salamii]